MPWWTISPAWGKLQETHSSGHVETSSKILPFNCTNQVKIFSYKMYTTYVNKEIESFDMESVVIHKFLTLNKLTRTMVQINYTFETKTYSYSICVNVSKVWNIKDMLHVYVLLALWYVIFLQFASVICSGILKTYVCMMTHFDAYHKYLMWSWNLAIKN